VFRRETREPTLLWIPPAAVAGIRDGTVLLSHPGRRPPLPRDPSLGADAEVVHVLYVAGSRVKCNNYG